MTSSVICHVPATGGKVMVRLSTRPPPTPNRGDVTSRIISAWRVSPDLRLGATPVTQLFYWVFVFLFFLSQSVVYRYVSPFRSMAFCPLVQAPLYIPWFGGQVVGCFGTWIGLGLQGYQRIFVDRQIVSAPVAAI